MSFSASGKSFAANDQKLYKTVLFGLPVFEHEVLERQSYRENECRMQK